MRTEHRLADIVLVFLVLALAAAGRTPDGNEAHYLAKARHYWDPAFGAGDFYLESRDAHVVFYWLAGWLTTWVSLAAAAWVGRIVTWCLLAWAWVRLCHALLPRGASPVLAAALWLACLQAFDLAGEWVVGGFEAKPCAYVLMLLALEALVRRQWNRVWIQLGAAIAIHPLVGGWSAMFSGIVWLRERRRPDVLRMGPALVVGAGLALFGLIPALRLNQGTPPTVVEAANQIYVFERLPHHLALTTLPAVDQAVRYGRHVVMLALFAGLCVVIPAGGRQRRLRTWIWSAAAAAATGLVVSVASHVEPVIAARLLRYYWFRVNDVALAIGVALLAVRGLRALQIQDPWNGRRIRRALTLATALFFAGGLIGRFREARPAPDRDVVSYEAWAEVCEWIAVHAPPGSRFLTPRKAQTFTWRTGLAQVVTEKDIPQDAAGIVEWRNRLNEVHFHMAGGARVPYVSLAELGEIRLLALGARFDARFVLTGAQPALDLPVVYANEVYAVYDLRGAE